MSKTALITGATAGIGYELAKCFARDGHDLVLVARSEERLQKVADELSSEFKISARSQPSDLSRPEAPQELFDAVNNEGIAIDFLVNNAGFGVNGKFVDTDLQSELDMIQVNVTSLVALSKLFLKGMVERGSGRIMNVASTASFQPGPNMSIYCATKAFVLSFSEAIANELKGTGVTVTAVCPGGTATEFQERANIKDIPLVNSGMMPVMKAEDVARIGYKAFMKGETTVVTGFFNKLGVFSTRISPRSVVTQMAGKMMEKKAD